MKIRLLYLAPLVTLFAVLLTVITLLSPSVNAQSRESSAANICGPANYDDRNPNANVGGSEPTEEEYKTKRDACIKGFNAALRNNATAPKNQAPYGPCYTDDNLYKNNSSLAPSCHTGYARAYADREKIKEQPEREPGPTEEERKQNNINTECSRVIPEASNKDALVRACANGYTAAEQGKDREEACPASTSSRQFCLRGFDIASGTYSEDEEDDSCERAFASDVSWIVCAISDPINTFVAGLDNAISDLLHVDTDRIFRENTRSDNNPSPHYYEAWNSFRVIALGLIFIAALIVIISSALGFEILDAYTIRKTLPRLILAVIFISLSWSILEFLIQLTNDIGTGIRALIYAPFEDFEDGVEGSANIVALALAGIGLAALGPMGLLSFGATALLAVLIAFTILILRELILIFIVLVAPVAIAAMILPNTRKVWDLWRSTLVTLLVVFPIIMGMIAMGRVFSAVTQTAGDDIFYTIIAFIAYFLPYFLLPFAFRLAGGVIGTLAGLGNDRSRGAFDRLRNFRKARGAENWQKTKNFSRFSERTPVGRGVNTALGAATNPRSLLRGRRGVAATRKAMSSSYGAGALKDNQIWNDNQGDDSFLLAVASRELAKTKMQKAITDSQDMTKTAAERAAAQRSAQKYQHALDLASQMGQTGRSRGVRVQALSALAKTGFQFDAGQEGYRQLSTVAREISGGDNGVYSSIMNESQYGLRTAGRFDLGGINDGAGYDPEAGVKKASLYQLANAKPASIDAMVEAAGTDLHRRATTLQELRAMLPNATGATQDKIIAQIQNLEGDAALRTHMGSASGRVDSTGAPMTVQERIDYDHTNPAHATWSPAEKTRGWRAERRPETMADLANKAARTYERPDPNNMP